MTTQYQYLVRKVETCKECGGCGVVQNMDWAEINQANNAWMEEHGIQTFTDEAAEDWNHRIKAKWPYRKPPPEEEPCCECEGAGEIERWVPLAEAIQALGVECGRC